MCLHFLSLFVLLRVSAGLAKTGLVINNCEEDSETPENGMPWGAPIRSDEEMYHKL
jgi:hypothetical protein